MNARQAYRMFRQAGMTASHAMYAARAMVEFADLEAAGLVRLQAEPEQEGYFSVWGEPDGYTDIRGRWHSPEQERAELVDQLERFGNWVIYSEWRESDDSEWQTADSVGQCMGYRDPLDPRENWYVVDLMRSAVKAAQAERYSI